MKRQAITNVSKVFRSTGVGFTRGHSSADASRLYLELLSLFSCYLTAVAKFVAAKSCRDFYSSLQSSVRVARSSFTYPNPVTLMETVSRARWVMEQCGQSLLFGPI